MSSKNKLYTRSYFIKRLKEEGLFVIPNLQYPVDHVRQWSIVIDPQDKYIICTCYKKSTEDFWFRLETDSNCNINVVTSSMVVMCETIKNLIDQPQNGG